jgi:transposase
MLLAHLEQVLMPALKCARPDAILLPRYSPEFNPIEHA